MLDDFFESFFHFEVLPAHILAVDSQDIATGWSDQDELKYNFPEGN